MELSIETLVVFVMVLVVLVAVIMFFMNVGGKGSDEIGCKADFQAACNDFLLAKGCSDLSVRIQDYMSPSIAQCGVGSSDYELARDACCQ